MRRPGKFLAPLLVVVFLTAAWFEPTHCVRGWLRGESFYQGRPTSYWSAELREWHMIHGNPHVVWYRNRTVADIFLLRRSGPNFPVASPPLLDDGNPAARPVLEGLLADTDPDIRMLAAGGLELIEFRQRNP